jgi:hypothetical protein
MGIERHDSFPDSAILTKHTLIRQDISQTELVKSLILRQIADMALRQQ